MQVIQSIQNRIYEIRGERAILGRDLVRLYETEIKALNLAVKRNIRRFPGDFMFQLTKQEYEYLKGQIEALERNDHSLRLQIETLKNGRGQHRKYLPYAFTSAGSCNAQRHITVRKGNQHEYFGHACFCRDFEKSCSGSWT
jgi:hypothetical protein